MARVPARNRATRALWLSCLLLASLSVSIHPVTAHEKCDGLNVDNGLVTGHSINQTDGGNGSDVFHRKMKTDVSINVNERHCRYWMQLAVLKWDGNQWNYEPGKVHLKYVESNNPNGMAPQTHSMIPSST